MISERTAWLRIAKAFREAKLCASGIVLTAGYSAGLCSEIFNLFYANAIDDGMRSSMFAKLDTFAATLGKGTFGYIWPTNADGAKERVKFCMGEARKLAPRKLKAKAKPAAKSKRKPTRKRAVSAK